MLAFAVEDAVTTPAPITTRPPTSYATVMEYENVFDCSGDGVEKRLGMSCEAAGRTSHMRSCSEEPRQLVQLQFTGSTTCNGAPSSTMAWTVGKCYSTATGSFSVTSCPL